MLDGDGDGDEDEDDGNGDGNNDNDDDDGDDDEDDDTCGGVASHERRRLETINDIVLLIVGCVIHRLKDYIPRLPQYI